ncbi:MAG: hypothetical protein ACLS9R_07790 [Anaerobutyricum hallii]|uniref:prenylated flavin chaperone LpdD n=1 Tax=Anaerobutyricum hallii TaxID=39488 RepID=UPI003994A074
MTRILIEKICGKMEIVIVCIGGFHLDGIVKEQIKEVIEVAEQMSEEILQELEKVFVILYKLISIFIIFKSCRR